MGALDNGFRLKPDTQPIDGDVLLYDAATDSLRAGGAIPGAVGVTSSSFYAVASGSVEAGTSLGAGATEIATDLRVVFTAPASGKVLILLRGFVESPAVDATLYWYPRIVVDATSSEAQKPALRAGVVVAGSPQFKRWTEVPRIITGLTGGVVYRMEWQHAATVAGFFLKPDSGVGQQAIATVTALP